MARQLSRSRTARTVDPEPDEDYDAPEEETRRPARSSRAKRDVEPRGRRRDADESDEETQTRTRRPARGRSASRSEPSGHRPGRSGWEGVKHNKEKRQTGDEFKVKEDVDYLIKFLQPKPMENGAFLEHFIKALANNSERASFVCLEDDCPLCDIGDKPGDRALFNIAVLDDKGNATVMYWKATSSVLDMIEDYAESERNSPIDRDDLYFQVSKKKGKNKFFAYKMDVIRARDLEDDGIEPLSEDELEDLLADAFEVEDVLKVSSRRELRDIADGLED